MFVKPSAAITRRLLKITRPRCTRSNADWRDGYVSPACGRSRKSTGKKAKSLILICKEGKSEFSKQRSGRNFWGKCLPVSSGLGPPYESQSSFRLARLASVAFCSFLVNYVIKTRSVWVMAALFTRYIDIPSSSSSSWVASCHPRHHWERPSCWRW